MLARRFAPVLLGLAVLLPLSCTPGPHVPGRIVLITIDTLRADRVGAYGDPAAQTPHLDAVASGGVRFENAISPTPLTLPSHASLHTGLDPPFHGARHNGVFRVDVGATTLAERMAEAGFPGAAFVAAVVLDRRLGLARGFTHYDDSMELWGPSDGVRAVAERRGDIVVDSALAWLAEAPERFFLWVHLYDPHAPYEPPSPFDDRFSHDPYAGEIAFADAQVGRLLSALAARWPDDSTLVAITSDHGESLGEHGEQTHSYSLYDATQRVPLLIRGPGIPRGRVVRGQVGLVDVAPTLLGAAGAEPLENTSGRDLAVRWLAPHGADPVSHPVYLETLAPQLDMRWSPLLGLRDGKFKYVRAPRPELYDLEADPLETHNLAELQEERVHELDDRLTARLAGAPQPRPLSDLAADDRHMLESLGYVARVPSRNEALALGSVGGTDPKDEMHVLDRFQEANALLSAGQAEAAWALLEDLGGRGLEVELVRAAAAFDNGRLEDATRAARIAITLAPREPYGYGILGAALRASGDFEGARTAFRTAAELAPEAGWPLTKLGYLAEAQGHADQAALFYERARAARQPRAPATWLLAALRLEEGKTREAAALLAELPPHHLREETAARRLAVAEATAGRIPMGLLRVEAGLRERPGSLGLMRTRALLLELDGRQTASLEVRTQVLEMTPDDPAAWNDLAWGLAVASRGPDRALELVTAAIEAKGPLPTLLDTLAFVHLRRGEAEAALVVAERALEDARDDQRTLPQIHRAEALLALGREEAALESILTIDREALRDPLARAEWDRVRTSLKHAPTN